MICPVCEKELEQSGSVSSVFYCESHVYINTQDAYCKGYYRIYFHQNGRFYYFGSCISTNESLLCEIDYLATHLVPMHYHIIEPIAKITEYVSFDESLTTAKRVLKLKAFL
jgi:hypothetical protein